MTYKAPLTPSRYDSSEFLRKKLKFLLKNNQEIIDVGCGKLYFLDLLNLTDKKINYLGIDINPKVGIQFKKNISGKIMKKSILSFKSNKKFDLIVCLWVLEHIKDDKLAQKIMINHLKNNGYLVVAVPSVWSWPIEFGRHGFHYYSLDAIKKIGVSEQLQVKEVYEAGGILGLLFTLAYNWPRFIILIPSLILYKILSFTKITELSWPQFSKKAIDLTWYRYHKSSTFVGLHNRIVREIVKIDSFFKIFPQSYIIILQKV